MFLKSKLWKKEERKSEKGKIWKSLKKGKSEKTEEWNTEIVQSQKETLRKRKQTLALVRKHWHLRVTVIPFITELSGCNAFRTVSKKNRIYSISSRNKWVNWSAVLKVYEELKLIVNAAIDLNTKVLFFINCSNF